MLAIGTQGVVKQIGGTPIPAVVMAAYEGDSVDIRLDYAGTPFFQLGTYPVHEVFPDDHPFAGQPHPRAGRSRRYDWFLRVPVAMEPSMGAFSPTAPASVDAPEVAPSPAQPTPSHPGRDLAIDLAQLKLGQAEIIAGLAAIEKTLACLAPFGDVLPLLADHAPHHEIVDLPVAVREFILRFRSPPKPASPPALIPEVLPPLGVNPP